MFLSNKAIRFTVQNSLYRHQGPDSIQSHGKEYKDRYGEEEQVEGENVLPLPVVDHQFNDVCYTSSTEYCGEDGH